MHKITTEALQESGIFAVVGCPNPKYQEAPGDRQDALRYEDVSIILQTEQLKTSKALLQNSHVIKQFVTLFGVLTIINLVLGLIALFL